MTPFLAGQAAYRAGQGVEANPHDPATAFTPDEYPGPYANWRDGWNHAQAMEQHTERMTK